MGERILHIAKRDDWAAARAAGSYVPDSLATEGFIHCSTERQVVRVANAHMAGVSDLILLEIDPTGLPLRFEPGDPGSSEEFPHLYEALPVPAVVAVHEFPPAPDGTFSLPDSVTT